MPPSANVHTIRLRKPWQKQFDGHSDGQRVDVPESNTSDRNDAIATYQRQFNRPTGITQGTVVKLDIGTCVGTVHAIVLNEHQLSTNLPMTVDVTDRLQDHNQLVLRIGPSDAGIAASLTGSVNLLICEPEPDDD